MNRRSFFKRLSKAALAFSVAPGVFKALPSSQHVLEVVAPSVKVVPFWIQTTRRSRCVDAAYAKYFSEMTKLSLAPWESDFKKEFGVGPFAKWPV